MNNTKENILTIKVTGKNDQIPVASFLEVIRDSLQILMELDTSITDQPKATLEWDIIGASLNTPLLISVSAHTQVVNQVDISNKVIQTYVTGLEQIEKGTAEIPKYFTGAALFKARQMVSVLNKGIREIAFSTSDGLAVTPSGKTAANIDTLLQENPETLAFIADESRDIETDHDDETEEEDSKESENRIGFKRARYRKEEKEILVGRLETVHVHADKSTFVIYDPQNNTRINCTFSKDDLEKVKEALPSRVSVIGTARYNEKGQVTSIKVDTFTKLRLRKELPQAKDLESINFTGGLDPTEYVRRLRNG